MRSCVGVSGGESGRYSLRGITLLTSVDETDVCNAQSRTAFGVSDRSSLRRLACGIRSITPTHATLSATGYILLQPEPAKATAWSLPEHFHGHPGQGLATGRIDLAGHDQGARLVLRDFQFCEACAQLGWSSYLPPFLHSRLAYPGVQQGREGERRVATGRGGRSRARTERAPARLRQRRLADAQKFLHLGTWAVVTKPDKPVDELHWP